MLPDDFYIQLVSALRDQIRAASDDHSVAGPLFAEVAAKWFIISHHGSFIVCFELVTLMKS